MNTLGAENGAHAYDAGRRAVAECVGRLDGRIAVPGAVLLLPRVGVDVALAVETDVGELLALVGATAREAVATAPWATTCRAIEDDADLEGITPTPLRAVATDA